ncbi:hypothetical protein [Burkholderia alba]|uniref:hypothetical protein n=1 Tax=Burkholderia alba TaxID=2683677 RepID=UPI002B05569C|nr:hypothetical protein [Burkholderia alba]
MQQDPQTIGLGACVKGAWRDALGILRAGPGTALTIWLLMLVADGALKALRQFIAATRHSLPAGMQLAASGLVFACTLITLALLFGWSVQAMRFTVLGAPVARPHRQFGSPFWRYVRLTLAYTLLMFLALALTAGAIFLILHFWPMKRAAAVFLIGLFSVGVGSVLFFVSVRISLLFCHAALNRRTDWRAGWRDSADHVWSISLTHLVASLPMIVATIALTLIQLHLAPILHLDALSLLFAIAGGALTFVGATVSGACSGWLYRRYADRLLAAA